MDNKKVTGSQALILDVEKVRYELERIGQNYSWLASKLGVTRQYVSLIFKSRSIYQAPAIADILGVDAKFLIKTVRRG